MKILMLVTGDSSKDTRVQHEKQALEGYGHRVIIVDWIHSYHSKIITIPLLIKWWKKAYKYCLTLDFDVVHCHDFDTLFVGVLLKKKTGCKLVYDAHELYAYMVNMKIILPFEKFFLENVDKCIAVHEKVEEYLHKLDRKNIYIVRNCKSQISKKYLKPSKHKGVIVSYFGILSDARMFPELIDIIGDLSNIQFIVGGYGQKYDEVKERCKKYDNITFKGWQSEKEVLICTLYSDAVICMLNPNNINCRNGLPNKFFECMVTGRPLIVTSNTYAGKLIDKLDCGYTVRYSSYGIITLLRHIFHNKKECKKLGENAFKLGKERYNWEIEKMKLLEIYEELK